MAHAYGEIIQSLSEYPAGLDNSALFTMWENSGSWAQIVAFDYRGGDASEVYSLYLVPPNNIQDGSNAPADVPGCVALMAGMAGGDGSVAVPAPYTNYRPALVPPVIIPPYWSLALQNATATNTNAVFLNILFVELSDS